MVGKIRVKEIDRDDNLAISKKEISFPKNKNIITPTRNFAAPVRTWKQYKKEEHDSLDINEISQRLDMNKIESLSVTGTELIKRIKRRYVPNKINLYIPHLRIKNEIPPKIRDIFSQFLCSVSDTSIILPTIDFSFLKELRSPTSKTKVWSMKRINYYKKLLINIIHDINSLGNGKVYIGIIPLMPSDFIIDLITAYNDEGINSFLIDAGTRDIVDPSQFEFRSILATIRAECGDLEDKLFLASNLGYGQFKQDWTLANDFLSFFINIDILGNTFKTRGFSTNSSRTYVPKAKVFSKEEYVYTVSSYKEAEESLGIDSLNRISLRKYNEFEQKIETNNLQSQIGQENLSDHLLKKDHISLESKSFKNLQSFQGSVKSLGLGYGC